MDKENYRLDGEPRALYYTEYRQTLQKVKDRLTVGEVIPEDLSVLFVGNNGLLPTSFDLRNVDRQPVGEFIYPGKSANVAFTENLDVACSALFDRKSRRTDHLYIAQVSDLQALGFFPYYLPLPNLPLHLRVVHDAQRRDPSARDIPYRARVGLVDLLNSHKIC